MLELWHRQGMSASLPRHVTLRHMLAWSSYVVPPFGTQINAAHFPCSWPEAAAKGSEHNYLTYYMY